MSFVGDGFFLVMSKPCFVSLVTLPCSGSCLLARRMDSSAASLFGVVGLVLWAVFARAQPRRLTPAVASS